MENNKKDTHKADVSEMSAPRFRTDSCEEFVCKICTTDNRIIKGVMPWEDMKM